MGRFGGEKLGGKVVCVFIFIARYILCARTLGAVLICREQESGGGGKGRGRKRDGKLFLERRREIEIWAEIMKLSKNVERYAF